MHSAGLDCALVKRLVQVLGQQLYRGLHPYSTDSILQLQVHLLGLPVGGYVASPVYPFILLYLSPISCLRICAMDARYSEGSDAFSQEG